MWLTFTESLQLDSSLSGIADPVPILQVFAARYRDGRIAPSKAPV